MSITYKIIKSECIKELKDYLPCKKHTCENHDIYCDKTCIIDNDCSVCLTNMFRKQEQAQRRYNCIPITLTYIKRYANRYASEIYNFFLRNNYIDKLENANIVSIGCGPGTEVIGLERYIRENNIKGLNYYGFDENPIWNNVQKIVANNTKNILNVNFTNLKFATKKS